MKTSVTVQLEPPVPVKPQVKSVTLVLRPKQAANLERLLYQVSVGTTNHGLWDCWYNLYQACNKHHLKTTGEWVKEGSLTFKQYE